MTGGLQPPGPPGAPPHPPYFPVAGAREGRSVSGAGVAVRAATGSYTGGAPGA